MKSTENAVNSFNSVFYCRFYMNLCCTTNCPLRANKNNT